MRELNTSELHAVQGGGLPVAMLVGGIVTLAGWAGIIYHKDVLYQLYKIDNVALVCSLGAAVGGLSYLAGLL